MIDDREKSSYLERNPTDRLPPMVEGSFWSSLEATILSAHSHGRIFDDVVLLNHRQHIAPELSDLAVVFLYLALLGVDALFLICKSESQ